jgi:hypothetical protein
VKVRRPRRLHVDIWVKLLLHNNRPLQSHIFHLPSYYTATGTGATAVPGPVSDHTSLPDFK